VGNGVTDSQTLTEREAQWQPDTNDYNAWPGGQVAQTHTYCRHYKERDGVEDHGTEPQRNTHQTTTWAAVNRARDPEIPPYYDDHIAATDSATWAAQPQLNAHPTTTWTTVNRPTTVGMPSYHRTVNEFATRVMEHQLSSHRAAPGFVPIEATANRGISNRLSADLLPANRHRENRPMATRPMPGRAITSRGKTARGRATRARPDSSAMIRPMANTVSTNRATEAQLQLYPKFQRRDSFMDSNAPPTHFPASTNYAPAPYAPPTPNHPPSSYSPATPSYASSTYGQAATNNIPAHHRPAATRTVRAYHAPMPEMNEDHFSEWCPPLTCSRPDSWRQLNLACAKPSYRNLSRIPSSMGRMMGKYSSLNRTTFGMGIF
jgi:hypothetical protein